MLLIADGPLLNAMSDYLTLPIGDRCPELVNAVIEVPLGGVNKYEYDKQLRVFRLDRTLYSPVHYPGDYGFIPSTKAGDGDPLDVLVLVDDPSFPGCVIEVRPIGMLEMTDQGARDEKVLAVGNHNPRYREVMDYRGVYPHIIREIEHFFSIYKDLEGKRTKTIAWHDAAGAHRAIVESRDRFLGKAA
jgi:inorganic pyrophosphatase